MQISTRLIHGDDALKPDPSVSPAISTSTTFKTPLPQELEAVAEPAPFDPANPSYHIYSRYTQPTIGRAERLLSSVLNGHALLLSSGLAAAFSALMFLNPTVIAIRGGYHGCHVTIDLFKRIKSNIVRVLRVFAVQATTNCRSGNRSFSISMTITPKRGQSAG